MNKKNKKESIVKKMEEKIIDVREDKTISLPYLERGITGKFFDKLDKIFDFDWVFIVLVTLLSMGIVLGTSMYVEYGVGAFNEIFVVKMLDDGLQQGEWSAVIGFASGFLIARVLEAPLVGILDIGGSIATGVGIGVPAVFLQSDSMAFMIENPAMSLIIGAALGVAIGLAIYIVRLVSPKEEGLNLGTDIMMGAGNQTGAFLGPLVLIAASMYNPICGIGAALGSLIFFYLKKPIVGGAIIGAMILGIIPAYV